MSPQPSADRDLEALALAVLAAARSTTAQAAIVEATAARLVDELAQRPAPESATLDLLRCQHPDDARRDAGTMSAPRRFFCADCRAFVNPAARAADTPEPVAAP